MSDDNYRSSCGGPPSRGGHSLLPRLSTLDIRWSDTAVASNAWPQGARSSARQRGVNGSWYLKYTNDPYKIKCVQDDDSNSLSIWSSYAPCDNGPVAYSNDSQWHSSDGGGGQAFSEARYTDDGYNSVHSTAANLVQPTSHGAHGSHTTWNGRSQGRGSFHPRNDSFQGTPQGLSADMSRLTDGYGHHHTTLQPNSAVHLTPRPRQSSPKPPPPSPFLDPSKPITGFFIVKGKIQGFRYPTTLPNYQQELPVGTVVVVWRDRGEAIGEVIGYVSTEKWFLEHQRVQLIKEGRLPAEEASLQAVSGNDSSARNSSRSSPSSSFRTSHEPRLDSGELAREYNRSASPDVQEKLREIVNADTMSTRVLRVATENDHTTWRNRQEEDRQRHPVVSDVFARTFRSNPRKCNNTPLDSGDHAADSTGIIVEQVECQLDGKKLTVYLARQNTASFVDFNRLVSRLHKKFKCRVEVRYKDEIEEDNDHPAHIERIKHQREQREVARKAEASRQPPKESCGVASPPPS